MDDSWRQSINGFVMKILVMLVSSGILQLVGLVTPGWIVIKTSSVDGQMGLFYAKVCVKDTCQTKTYDEFASMIGNTAGLNGMREYQAEAITGLLFCIISIVVILVAKRRMQMEGNRNGLIISCVTAALSTILSLVAAGQIANSTIKAHNLLEKLRPGESPFGFPYSVVITGLGGILTGFCVLGSLVKILSQRTDNSPQAYSNQALPPNVQVYSTGTQPNTVYYQPPQGTPNQNMYVKA